MNLLIILLLIRLYARINMFKLIEEKYGCNGIKVGRSIQVYRTKSSKIKFDIDFLLTCKRNNLILAVKVSFQLRNKKLWQIIEAEVKNKHRKKKIFLNQIKKRQEELKSRVGMLHMYYFVITSIKLSAKKKELTGWRHTTRKFKAWKEHRRKQC